MRFALFVHSSQQREERTVRAAVFINPSVTSCHRNASGHGRGRRLDTNNFLSLPKIVSVALICVICSFFSATRRTNQEAPPFLLTPPSLRTPPLYFALQNTGEEGEMYFFALISVKCDTMGGEIAFFFFGI